MTVHKLWTKIYTVHKKWTIGVQKRNNCSKIVIIIFKEEQNDNERTNKKLNTWGDRRKRVNAKRDRREDRSTSGYGKSV